MTLKELFAVACKNAQKIFEADYEVHPIWHAVTADNQNMVIATPWSNEEEKDSTVDALREFFKENNVERYAFVCEAWTALLTPTETDAATALKRYTGPRASEHPDRREVLRIQAEDRNGQTISGHFFILRPEHDAPKLSPLHMEDYDGAVGRMTGLLQTKQ